MPRKTSVKAEPKGSKAIQPGDVVRIHGYDVQYYAYKQMHAPHKRGNKARTVVAELHCYQKSSAASGTQFDLVLRVCFHDLTENLPGHDFTRIPYQLNYPLDRLAGILLTLQSGGPVLFFPEENELQRLRTNTIGWFGETGTFAVETVAE